MQEYIIFKLFTIFPLVNTLPFEFSQIVQLETELMILSIGMEEQVLRIRN